MVYQNAAEASESERSLSSALIGGAFGFIGLAIFASASYAEKVSPTALSWGNAAAMLSVLFFLVSIILGGYGWTRKCPTGFFNPFNLQAISGLVGLIVLAVSAVLFAFNPKEQPSTSNNDFIKRLEAVERDLTYQRKRIDALMQRVSIGQAGVSTAVSDN